jgi:hypothetical protein
LRRLPARLTRRAPAQQLVSRARAKASRSRFLYATAQRHQRGACVVFGACSRRILQGQHVLRRLRPKELLVSGVDIAPSSLRSIVPTHAQPLRAGSMHRHRWARSPRVTGRSGIGRIDRRLACRSRQSMQGR